MKSEKRVKMRTVTGKVKLDQDVTVNVPALNVQNYMLSVRYPEILTVGSLWFCTC